MPKRANFHKKPNLLAAVEADYSLDHDPQSLLRKQATGIQSASCWRTVGCILSDGTNIRTGFQQPESYHLVFSRSKGQKKEGRRTQLLLSNTLPYLNAADLGAPRPLLTASCWTAR